MHNLRRERPRPGDARIDRATAFGNPFVLGRDGTRAEAIARLEARERARVAADAAGRAAVAVAALHGRRLFCWCAPEACHGDVLARLAAEIVEGGGTR